MGLPRPLVVLAALGVCHGAQTSGTLAASLSSQLQRLGDAHISAVACLGARNSGKGSLLSKVLGTPVPDVEVGVATALDEEGRVAVLNTEGFGERLAPPAGDADADAEDAVSADDTALAVALSDVLVFNVFFREFVSDPADSVGSLSELRPALHLLMRMSRESGDKAPRKRTLFLVVRDFEADEGVNVAQISEKFHALLDSMWASLAHVPGVADLEMSDLLDIEVVPLTHPNVDETAFQTAVSELKAKLGNAASVAASASSASQLLASLALAQKIAATGSRRSPGSANPEELFAATACARASTEAFDEYVTASADLHARALQRDRREPLLSLADDSSMLLANALRSYDVRTSSYNGTEAYAARRKSLHSMIIADLRPLYTENVQLAVKLAAADFYVHVQNISTTPGTDYEAEVQSAMDMATSSFRTKARELRMPEAGSKWSEGLDLRMLQQELQTVASELVRRAQLQGYHTPATPRIPTSVSLHWLHPNPFGKDMRTDALTASDRLAYSERAKNLLRSSPMRTNPGQSAAGSRLTASAFSGGIKLTDEDLVLKETRRRRR